MTGPRVLLAQQKPVFLYNALTVRQEIRYYSDVTNDWVPWVGGTDARVRFSRFPSGYDFDGTPSSILGPYALAESSEPGWYWATVNADEIEAFSDLVGQVVYQIVEGSYGTLFYDLTNVQPLLVCDPRAPIP